jgi:RNA-binding protein YhbY
MKASAINLLISKSIAHLKPSLQEKGLEAICCIIENTEDFEGVSEAVCASVKSTNVKVIGELHNITSH